MGAERAHFLQSISLTRLLCEGTEGYEGFLFPKPSLVCLAVLFFCVVLPVFMEQNILMVRI